MMESFEIEEPTEQPTVTRFRCSRLFKKVGAVLGVLLIIVVLGALVIYFDIRCSVGEYL